MQHETLSSYGLWGMVIINSAIFIMFAFSFAPPQDKRDWRSLGAFSAFLVALFTEMYGYPLTIFVLSGWLAEQFPQIDWLAHDSGHLLEMMFGWEANPHFGPFHIASNILIIGGFILIASAWKVLHAAQREGRLSTEGLYQRMRHPQYLGFILVMTGFLLQWPTLLTLVMYPILVFMYVRLARHEEADARRQFGETYDQYARSIPAFIPRMAGANKTTCQKNGGHHHD